MTNYPESRCLGCGDLRVVNPNTRTCGTCYESKQSLMAHRQTTAPDAPDCDDCGAPLLATIRDRSQCEACRVATSERCS